MILQRPVFLLSLVAAMLLCGGASAESPPIEDSKSRTPLRVNLKYEVPPESAACPKEEAFRAALMSRLGFDPVETNPSLDTISVHIRQDARELKGTIERWDPTHVMHGTPTAIATKSDNCEELATSLAVGVAILIDPLSILRGPDAPIQETERSTSTESPKLPEEKSTPLNIVLGAGPSLTVGALPSMSLGARVSAGLERGIFGAFIEGRFDPPASLRAEQGEVRASLGLATLVPCLHFEPLLLCGQASVGSLQGEGVGLDHSRHDTTLYIAAGARAGIEFPLARRVSIRLWAEGQVPLIPTHLEAAGTAVWSTPAFGFSLWPMLVGRFS